jgi:predicted  nucleic acid-binding Zn-ribbon protein
MKMSIEIAGNTYQKRTGNRCTTCSAAVRFMYVKMITASKDHVLECPSCSTIVTVSEAMVYPEEK